ncbi:MAG: exonuclease SbcCD subunit D [Firmicutes bacterium]|nr:exonuclease SbcCD subunit D [Bacillota bacterium]
MKFMHLSDLHLGKRVNEFSMIEDQIDILRQILTIAKDEAVDAVLIAGDVYDKPIPPVEAVRLLDQFLVDLGELHLPVFLISGNHDSVQRLSFGSRLLKEGGLFIAPEYDGTMEPVTLRDEFGDIDIYMLPFVKPAHVRRYFPDERIETYTDAVQVALSAATAGAHGAPQEDQRRRVLLSHQFVTGASRSESEEVSVGGLDNVDAEAYAGFDYVALGHIHGPQDIRFAGEKAEGGCPRIRYCGTPLKYSFSEADHVKSVTIVDLKEKGDVAITTVPLTPLHDMRKLRGTYLEVTSREFYREFDTNDYVQVTLTNEEDVPDAVGKLRIIYPNLMKMNYDNKRTRESQEVDGAEQVEQKSPLQLFEELYILQNNQGMSEEQKKAAQTLMETIWEEKQ